MLGSAVILTAFALGVVADNTPAAEQVGGFVFLSLPGLIGAAVRFWGTAARAAVGAGTLPRA
ncbi:hypothetical protein STANM309S_03187 [Streptomyces tanashiensis]